MTCEVAVMNRRGIALAADSAVTLGEGPKIYHTAEKLFSIAPNVPIAFMTFGAADLMNVPWETLIKMYSQRLSGRRFDTVDQCARDFFAFVEGLVSLFPESDQEMAFKDLVRAAWSDLYLTPLKEDRKKTSRHARTPDGLAEVVAADHKRWQQYRELDGLGLSYGQRVIETYGHGLADVEKSLFHNLNLSESLRDALRKTIVYMYGLDGPFSGAESGIVVAGMGETEPFPTLVQYNVGGVAAGRLRYAKADEAQVGRGGDAIVMPFAQRDTIDMIIAGIHPDLRQKLVEELAPRASTRTGRSRASEGERQDKVGKLIKDECDLSYESPFMSAVSALPRQDLAKMAEALVNLTVFLMQMSVDKLETVGGPVDVAILSKGEGFTWLRHKTLSAALISN